MEVGLIKKYNKAIPRYTSYPPVPKWDQSITDQKEWLKVLNQDIKDSNDQGISIYLHLPFCESLCTYCGCNKRITKRHEKEKPYIQALKQEWDIYRSALDHIPDLKYLHLGGGTPTFFSAEHLAEIVNYIKQGCTLSDNFEFSFEGHPNNTSLDHLQALYEVGFRRVSFGVQDFSLKVQKAIHRVQPIENVERVVTEARAIGYTSINFDLVYGLPFQTASTIAQTIHKVALFQPDRIALYSYAHVPWVSKSQRGYDESHLPDPADKLSYYILAKQMLLNLGYVEIGMDHFALPKDELSIAKTVGKLNRNFMGYTTDDSPQMIGLGNSSISSSKSAFVQNEKSVEAYQESVGKGVLPIIKSHRLTEEESAVGGIISALICLGSYDLQQDTDRFFMALTQLKEFEEDGLLELNDFKVNVTGLGTLFIRNICAAFDPFLVGQAETQKPMFSQSV